MQPREGQLHRSAAGLGRAFAIGVSLNVGFTAVEAWYGWRIGSLALLADALHNLSDVAALLLAWAAVWAGGLAASARHTYGFRRASIVAAFVNAVLLLAAMGVLIWEAIGRLRAPAPTDGQTIVVVAAIGVLVNGATAALFLRGSGHDLNLRGAFLHMAADALVSLGVVAAGLLYLGYGWQWLDPLASLIIALVVVAGTWGLFRQSLHLLFDGVPEGVDLPGIERWLRAQQGVAGLHDLHVWAMSTTEVALTAHLVMPEGHPGDAALRRIATVLHERFGIAHPTLQVETGEGMAAGAGCNGHGGACWSPLSSATPSMDTASPAAAVSVASPSAASAAIAGGRRLIADIGGTRARFALATGDGSPEHAVEYRVGDFADPASAIAAYLASLGDPPVDTAVLALAAPLPADPLAEVALTNAAWVVSPRVLRARFGWSRLALVNDFAALALALPYLDPAVLRQVGGGAPVDGAVKAVLGPGTGLGAAALCAVPGGWQALPGEGGHVTLAAGDAREAVIIERARARYAHVSAERLLSGSGLPLLHRLVAEVDGRAPPPEADAAAIVTAALEGDAGAEATIEVFCALLGSVAGNLALTLGARGGVYLGGGIVPRLGARFDRSPFRSRFEAKGRYGAYLAAIPVYVILSPDAGLLGAARAGLAGAYKND